MGSRSVMRFADWTLGVDPDGGPPIFEAECTSCGDRSEASTVKSGPEIWCLRHAGRTGHTGFRGIVTTFFRASLVDPVLAVAVVNRDEKE